jgi:hypothetical protein
MFSRATYLCRTKICLSSHTFCNPRAHRFVTHLAKPSTMARPSQKICTLLNIPCPDTPLIHAALDLAHAHSTPAIYNHVVRSFLFSCILGPQLLPPYDQEIASIAALLHDLGLDLTSPYSSPSIISTDKRFEIDSANAARAFLAREAPDWEHRKVQLVWDACALHSTVSIARHKEPEVVAASLGISADFAGPGEGKARVSKAQWDVVVKEWPREGMLEGIKDTLCELCRRKPGTTYDNWVGQYGEKYLREEGYSLDKKKVIDFIEASPL